ncbi:MAG: hypothetical protein ACLQDV_19745 [Candidatus Binataceae bacterium]
MADEPKVLETDPAKIAYPDGLKDRERELWCRRDRSLCGKKVADKPTVGFGLSGGGIRSATFCLGVFQALAKSNLLRPIDYISSVSGGGFFASFYGRMLAREDVSFEDIRTILSPNQGGALTLDQDPKSAPKAPPSWKSGVFRWLRENGRYLAPNGSGDLLIGITVFLRNWITVQLIVAISILAIFLVAQIFRGVFPEVGFRNDSLLWLSPYIDLVGLMALFGVVPLGWAYWAFAASDPGSSTTDSSLQRSAKLWAMVKFGLQGLPTLLTLAAVLAAVGYAATHVIDNVNVARLAVICAGCVLVITFFWWQFALLRGKLSEKADPNADHENASLAGSEALQSSKQWSTIAFGLTMLASLWALSAALTETVSTVIVAFGVLVIVAIWFWWLAIPTNSCDAINQSETARSLLSRWLRTILFATLAMLAFAAIDSAGQMLYAVSFTTKVNLRNWLVPIFAAIAAIVPFAQSIIAFFAPRKKGLAPSLPLKLIAGLGAAIIILPVLILLNGLSHAIAYDFGPPADAPPRIMAHYPLNPTPPCISGCPSASQSDGLKVAVVGMLAMLRDPCPQLRHWIGETVKNGCRDRRLPLCFLVLAVVFSALVGSFNSSWVFVNRTSLHALYGARLIRAYLGASNKSRYGSSAGVSDPVDGDDITQEEYWRPEKAGFWTKGAPLHLVNVTINETVDGSSQTEQRDRKGVGMAIGPAGFSVGVQHHVVFTNAQQAPGTEFAPVEIYPKPGVFSVFRTKDQPDEFKGQGLTLGNWAAISGAAVSTGLGSIGSLGTSLLTGFFNVRLGYWWNSGTKSITPGSKSLREGARFSSVFGKLMAWLLPVQSSLLDEFQGRFHGTLRKYWNLTDGGHFENLAGYELIRRRLPLIVIIDAGGDVDYDFADLANLIRKARLDFNADISFIDPKIPDGNPNPDFTKAITSVTGYFASLNTNVFGTIDQLRRGKWASEPVPERKAFFKSANEARLSLRHAALARITYLDDPDCESYLLLIKPSLIGEEPQDILNYHSANPDFPHESTAEQFFNEAQWESYRRLGQHIGEKVFS